MLWVTFLWVTSFPVFPCTQRSLGTWSTMAIFNNLTENVDGARSLHDIALHYKC